MNEEIGYRRQQKKIETQVSGEANPDLPRKTLRQRVMTCPQTIRLLLVVKMHK